MCCSVYKCRYCGQLFLEHEDTGNYKTARNALLSSKSTGSIFRTEGKHIHEAEDHIALGDFVGYTSKNSLSSDNCISIFDNFGDWVRTQRKDQEMKKVELSKLSGVSLNMIGNIEKGISTPSIFIAELLINALGFNVNVVEKEFVEKETQVS